MGEVRAALAEALPDSLMPVGAGLKWAPGTIRGRDTATERLTGYGALLLDALEPTVDRLLAHARAQALRQAAETLPEVGDVLRGMADREAQP